MVLFRIFSVNSSYVDFRIIFNIDGRVQQETLKQVKASILEGNSKWSAKIALTGYFSYKVP